MPDLADTVSTLRPIVPWVLACLLVVAAIVATIYGHDLAVPLLEAATRAPVPCECSPIACREG